MPSMIDLKKFFESDKTNFNHLQAPKDDVLEDQVINNEVKDLNDLAFSEYVEPTTNEPIELEEHRTPIYPWDS